MAQNYKNHDKHAGRPAPNLKAKDLYEILVNYGWRSALSGLPLSVQKQSPFDVSFDRVDNSQPHDIDNLRPVARIEQAHAGNDGSRVLTAATMRHFTLIQSHVPLAKGTRAYEIIKGEHNALKAAGEVCHVCEHPTFRHEP